MDVILKPYQKRLIDSFNQYCDYPNSKILEIGGQPPNPVARELLSRGARKVIVANNQENFPYGKFSDRFEFIRINAREMKFESESFYIVFGVAINERLPRVQEQE